MMTRREVLRLSAAGAFGAAVARASAAVARAAGAAMPRPQAGFGLDHLTAAPLRRLPPLPVTDAIVRTGRTRHYTLVLGTSVVEPLTGHKVPTRSVNGQSPGPVIRAVEGDDVEITVVNRLAQPTSIHWHGVPVPFAMDGAGMVSQRPVAPGETFTYRWTAPQAGTYMYHAHFRDLEQTTVCGVIVIDPASSAAHPAYAVDAPIMIGAIAWEDARDDEAQAVMANSMMMPSMAADPKADPKPGMGDSMDRMDMVEYWTFNGRAYPDTEPIVVREGDRVRLRFANVTNMTHPVHLHGHWFRVIAQDGNPLGSPQICNTVPVHSGQTVDIDFIANNPGVWPLHCHIIGHMVDNRDMMTGLVTVVRYEGFQPVGAGMG